MTTTSQRLPGNKGSNEITAGPVSSTKLLTPRFLLLKLAVHPLTKSLYPVEMGRCIRQTGTLFSHSDIPQYHLIYCTEGAARISTRTRELKLKRGDIAVFNPGESYDLYAEQKQGVSLFWAYYEGELASNFSERLTMKMHKGIANVGQQPRVVADFETLLSLREQGYTATNVIHAVHLLQQVLSFLALQLRIHQPPGTKELDLEILETLMMDRLHTDLDLDTLAKRANLSKYYFTNKFKELTGFSPIDYFIRMKIQHACYLLETTDSSVKQIAASLGYSDPYYFSRLFKKICGSSPKEYRTSGH